MLWFAEGLIPGLPDLVNPNTSTMFWAIVTFLVLVVVLGRFAWRPLMAALEKREKTIRDSLDSAEELKAGAEKLLREYESRIAAAHDEVRKIVEEGRRSAEAVQEEIVGRARGDARETVERATREIEQARREALRDIRSEAVDLSISLASRVIDRSLDREDHEAFLRESMKDLKL